jgi:transcriptional regulator with XRE-family HTH domain
MAKKNNENKVQTRFKQPKRRLFLAQWRKYRDEMTQERLAERAGVSQGMISQLENGTSDYTGELLEKLAFGLNCQPADLIMRNPTDPKAPWTIWDRIKPELRAQALRVLETFADEEAA